MAKKRNTINKGVLITGLLVCAVLIAWLASLMFPQSKPPRISTPKSTAPPKVSTACKLFTLADAITILGARTKNDPSIMDAYSTDAEITICRYSIASAPLPEVTKLVSVLVRTAKTAEGAEYNRSIFGDARPAESEIITGVGDTAFWEERLSYLNILKGDTWYIIENREGVKADSGDLETSLKVYEQLKNKL
jgi:hypothetical protein